MRRCLLTLACLLACALRAQAAAPLAESDQRFDRGLYQEALKGYEALLASSDEPTRRTALYRAVECEALLFRYGEAARRSESAQLPQDPLWRARFLIQRAELAREFLKQYGYGSPTDQEQGQTDVFRRTPQQWHQQAQSAFRQLWPLRSQLLHAPIAQEAYFVDLKNAQTDLAPTLWDFAALRWTDYLLSQAPQKAEQNPPASSFVRPGYPAAFSGEAAPAVQAAAIMEDAARLPQAGRAAAAEQWLIRRLLIAFEHPDLVAAASDQPALADAAIKILESWLDDFSAPAAKAQAGWEAARLLDGRARYGESVALCRRVEKSWPSSRASKLCARLRAQTELPVLGLSAHFTAPPAKGAFTLHTRNLDSVFFRLYRVEPKELLQASRDRNDWDALRQPSRELIEAYAGRSPDQAWQAPVSTHAAYASCDTVASPPGLSPGLYLALASNEARFKPKASLLAGAIINVTRLLLATSVGAQGPERDFTFDPKGPRQRKAPVFHYYTFDALTGKARAASLDLLRRQDWGQAQPLRLATGPDGLASSSEVVSLEPESGQTVAMDALAQAGDSFAYESQAVYFNASVPAPIEVHLETDRPIYRPGQQVRLKVTVLRRVPRGYEVYSGPAAVSFAARDANYQEVFSRQLKLDGLGSAATEFSIPAGRLLGRFSLEASLPEYGRRFSGSAAFSVEEYKRPEFEVTVQESSGAWRYGRAASVTGAVRYYFGGPVPDAPVSYRIRRQAFIPWFCWWWRGGPVRSGEAVASGQAKTDADGRFSFAFTPQPQDPSEKEPRPATFIVEVESRDAGGRTITAQRSLRAGAKAYLFDIAPGSGFLAEGQPASVAVRLMNLAEAPVAGEGGFELFALSGRPQDAPTQPFWGGAFPPAPSLESLYQDVPDGAQVSSGRLSFSPGQPAQAELGALKAGAYRLKVRAQDPWGGVSEQSIVLLCAGQGRLRLGLPEVTIPEHVTYLAGETARILLGSDDVDGDMFVEVWGGRNLLERRTLPGGVRILSLPVTDDHKGGFTVRWFGAKDFRLHSGQAQVSVPWKDRELALKLDSDQAIRPGQEVDWKLSAVDRDGKPVSGEALVRVFDRSLEYYAKSAGSWLASLYGARPAPPNGQGSLFEPRVGEIPVEEGWIESILKLFAQAIREPQPPMLRLNRSRVFGTRHRFGALGGLGEVASSRAMDAAVPAPMPEGGAMQKVAAKKADSPEAEAPAAVRADFSETAYFEPQLKLVDGQARVAFKAPEQLTSWKIQVSALTKDVKRAELEAETVTRKDLMVRVDIPRFFREGDQGRIQAVVHNETDSELAGEVTLSASEDGQPAAEQLGLSGLVKPFAVKAHGLAPLSWSLKVPRGQTSFKVRAVARSGRLVDAEERELPILPSRQRLIETALVGLDGTVKKTLEAPKSEEEDETRRSESMTLQIDPQLALSVLDSLPFLVHYPYECSEQLIDRYAPLAIVNAFYQKNPQLAEAVKKLPKRDTLTPAWDRKDPRRLMSLMETPWEELSQGRKSSWPVIDMFDPAVVKSELEDAQAKLKSSQNPDGGYAWFSGGRSDPYITLLVLAGWAEAQRYGVEVPMDAAARALGYVDNEIPKHLKPEPGEVSLILYAAYVVTSFPKSLPEAGLGFTFAKAWIAYADQHSDAMTQMGKALAAYVYWRLGDKAQGDLYLARAMDGARQDPIAGLYWTPEKLSWLWYNDTVETQAFILRTLLALRPQDPRIPGLVQWLLFNRKGNEWKSTKASAAAIYSLLDVLKTRGALDRGDRFTVQWGPQALSAQVEPFDWLAQPLRWTRLGSEVTRGHGKAEIDKQGPGLAFASLTWILTTDRPATASGPGLLELSRRYFLRRKQGGTDVLTPLKSGESVAVGDQVEVQLEVAAKSQFEYLHLQDPKPAGFEAEELKSGWKWDRLARYEEPRDSLTNFFLDWLPHGEYVLRYRLRPTTPGLFRVGPAVLQSLYAPEMSAHSGGFVLQVAP